MEFKKVTYGRPKYKNIYTDRNEEETVKFLKPKSIFKFDITGTRKYVYSKDLLKDGVWTNGELLIIDKEKAKEIFEFFKQELFNDEYKKRQNAEVATKLVEKQVNEPRLPNWGNIVNSVQKHNKKEAKFTGNFWYSNNKHFSHLLEYTDGEVTVYLEIDSVAAIRTMFPSAKLYLRAPMVPVVFKDEEGIKAILMPIEIGNRIDGVLTSLKYIQKEENMEKRKVSFGMLKKNIYKDETEAKIMAVIKPRNQINDTSFRAADLCYSKEGQEMGVWTNKALLIIDKEVTEEIYQISKNRFIDKLMKKGYTEGEALEEFKEKQEYCAKFPKWEQVIPSADEIGTEEAKPTGRYILEDGRIPLIEYANGETKAVLNAHFVASIKNKFPDSSLFLTGKLYPAVVKVGNTVKAVVMPYQMRSDTEFKNIDDE